MAAWSVAGRFVELTGITPTTTFVTAWHRFWDDEHHGHHHGDGTAGSGVEAALEIGALAG